MVLGRNDAPMSNRRAVGVFSTRREAEQALHELSASGFNMNHVSVITRDAERNQTTAGADVKGRSGNKADEGAGAGALTGGALGGLTGLLVGLGTLAIPGIGPVMLAGAAATTLATAAAGTAIGAASGGILGGLIGLGIPEREAKGYSDRVDRGDYLVIVDGSEAEIRQAEAILNGRNVQDWAVYDRTDADVNRAAVAPVAPVPVAPVPVAPVEPVAPVQPSVVPQPLVANTDDSIKLYEERLLVDKDREKTGEVLISKRVETETERVSVPIENERVIIERVTPTTDATVAGEVPFQEGTAIRVEVYEETPEIRKEAFVREEVNLRKEVDQETVAVEETLRREEINIDTEGNPIIDQGVNDRL